MLIPASAREQRKVGPKDIPRDKIQAVAAIVDTLISSPK